MTYPKLPRPNRQRIEQSVCFDQNAPNRLNALERLLDLDKPPENYPKPKYGSLEYLFFKKAGWITKKEEKYDRLQYTKNKLKNVNNSLKLNFSEEEFLNKHPKPKDSNEYTPELSASITKDKRLNGSCHRVLNHIAREQHKRNRKGGLETVKQYIAAELGVTIKTVGNALRRLQECGYIERYIINSPTSRMTAGLLIFLNPKVWPKHRRKQPKLKKEQFEIVEKQGRKISTQKYKYNNILKEKSGWLTVEQWNMEIFRGLMRTKNRLISNLAL